MDALMRRRQMMTAGGEPPAPAPVFYTYLKFDGVAYIDTDIIPDANASYRVNLGGESNKAAQRLFMVSADNSHQIGAIFGSGTTSTIRQVSFYYGASSAVISNKNLNFNAGRFTLYLTPKKGGWGTQVYSFTKGSDGPVGGLIIGSNTSHNGNPFSGSIKDHFLIYGPDAQDATDSNDLYNNYTPAYTLRPCTYLGEPGLWCVETSTFYGNSAGAGTLSVNN